MLNNYPLLKRVIFLSGIVMIGIALVLMIALLTGLLTQLGIVVDQTQVLPGESLIHTFVRLSVLGCMLCALGSFE